MFRIKRNLNPIWNDIAKSFVGTYKIVREYDKEEPVYHDDYIEPYKYTSIPFCEIEDIETHKTFTMAKSIFKTLFEII